MNLLIKRLFVLSILVMIGAAVVFFAIAVHHGPQYLAVACIFVAFIGFTMLPTSAAVEWFLPEGKQRGYGRVRPYVAVAILAVAFGYWTFAVVTDLMSPPAGSFSLIGVGAILLFLGYFMVFYVGLTRRNKELR